MWRRSSLVSQLISSSKSSLLLNQVKSSYGLKIWEAFSTEVYKQADGGTFPKEKTPFITFVLGGPGSGKGTQCSKIVETFGFTHLSAGDLLRKEISSNSENGSMILSTIKKGKIVPSEVTIKLIQRAIESTENDKFLIDGFPRTEANRIAYERIIGAEPNIVLFFDCPEEEMVKRVLSRNEGRVDDNIDTVKERLKVFRSLNLPVINYYSEKGILYKLYVGYSNGKWEPFACRSMVQGQKMRSLNEFAQFLTHGSKWPVLDVLPQLAAWQLDEEKTRLGNKDNELPRYFLPSEPQSNQQVMEGT